VSFYSIVCICHFVVNKKTSHSGISSPDEFLVVTLRIIIHSTVSAVWLEIRSLKNLDNVVPCQRTLNVHCFLIVLNDWCKLQTGWTKLREPWIGN